jgi:subtilisin family serine protease
MAEHSKSDRRKTSQRKAAMMIAAIMSIVGLGASAAYAQGMMRGPNLNIGPRVPSIASNSLAGVRPNIAGGANIASAVGRSSARIPGVGITSVGHRPPRIAVLTKLPYARYSANTYPSCPYVNRAVSGECTEQIAVDGNGTGKSGGSRKQGNGGRRNNPQVAIDSRTIANEIIAEIDGALSDAQADELAQRHGLIRLASLNVPLVGSAIGRFRITNGRSVETVRTELGSEASVRATQPNFRYVLQDQKSAVVLTEGDPAQYALAKLRLPQAHTLSRGSNVIVAVIDSGIDASHPELASAIADSFDALGSNEGPHVHGTGIAGAIVAHAKLMGSAPGARILAIRAFGVTSKGAESNSFVLLKALDYAVSHGAQVINMSFAGPLDPVIERGVAAAASKGLVLVAASGNAGAKSPPLYPAANPNVIAVSATDAEDRLFAPSNRGAHIAIAAPGVDIFLPAPDGKYQMTSGTSFSAAYISGLAALLLERNPRLKPEELRTALTKTARDLGAPGRDDLFGAGEADAFAAVSALQIETPPAMAAGPAKPAGQLTEQAPSPATRALTGTPSLASDQTTAH